MVVHVVNDLLHCTIGLSQLQAVAADVVLVLSPKRLRTILSSAGRRASSSRDALRSFLAARVEGRAPELQVIGRLFLIVAQAARGFLGSVDRARPASLSEVVAATKTAVSHLGLGYPEYFLLKLTTSPLLNHWKRLRIIQRRWEAS